MPVGGNETNHVYQITSVPQGCEAVHVGDTIRVSVVDPPPKFIILNYGGTCDGVVAALMS